jgi:hypothetical protein
MAPSRFWLGWLRATSVLFFAQSCYWAASGAFDPFGVYDRALAQAFFGATALPDEAERTFRFVLAPFGATSAAYFLLQLALVHFALARGERWAWWAVFGAFGFWFALDSALSLAHGARFNVKLANLPALALMLPAALGTARLLRRGA